MTKDPSATGSRPTTTLPSPPDGRLARGERTRRTLAEALIGLLEEGDPHPTARRIAERAGVSLRLVFHHFDDLDAVLQAAVAIQESRHWDRIRPVDATLPLTERVRVVVRQRCDVYQATAPVRRQAGRLYETSPTVAAEIGRARTELRANLEAAFAPELAGHSPGDTRCILDALDVATAWETWDQLQQAGRSANATRRTMERLTRAVIADALAGIRAR